MNNNVRRLEQENSVRFRKRIFLNLGMSFAFSAMAAMIIRTFFPSYSFLFETKIPEIFTNMVMTIPIVSGLWATFAELFNLIYGYVIFTIPFFVAYIIFKRKQRDSVSLRGGSVIEAAKLRAKMLLHDNFVIDYKATPEDIKNGKEIYEFEWGNERIPLDPAEISRGLLIIAKPGAGKTVAINNLIHGNVKEVFTSFIYKKISKFYENAEEGLQKNLTKRFINLLPNFIKKVKREQTSRGIKEYNRPMIFLERKGDDFAPKLLHRDLLNINHYLFDPLDEQGIKWNFMDEAIDKKTGKVDTGLVFFMVKILFPADETDHFAAQAQMAVYLVIIVVIYSKNPTMKHLIDYLQSHQDVMSLRKSIIRNEHINRLGLRGTAEAIFTIDAETGEPDGQARGVQSSMGRFIGKICLPEFYFEEGNFTITEFFRKLDKIEDYEKYKNMRLGVQNEAALNGRYNLYYGLFFALIFKRGFAMEQRESRKILLLLDEVQSFAEGDNKPMAKAILEGLDAFLAEARSRGFFTVVATQSVARIMEIVGDKTTNSLFQLLSAKLIMQYDEPLGSKFIVDYFGEEEIEEMTEGESAGVEMNSTKASTSIQKRINKKILSSQLTDLPRRSGFFKQGDKPITFLTYGINSGINISEKRINREIPETFNIEDIQKYKSNDLILDYTDEIVRVYDKFIKEGKDLSIPVLSEHTKLSEQTLFQLKDYDEKVNEIINEIYNVSTVLNFIEYCKNADLVMNWSNWTNYCNLTLNEIKELGKKYKKVDEFYTNLTLYKDDILEGMNKFNKQKEEIDMYIRDSKSNIQGYRDSLLVEKLINNFSNLTKDEILLYLFALKGIDVVDKGSLIKAHYRDFDFEDAVHTINKLSNENEDSPVVEQVGDTSTADEQPTEEELFNQSDIQVMNAPDMDLIPSSEPVIEEPVPEEEADYENFDDIDVGNIDLGEVNLEEDASDPYNS